MSFQDDWAQRWADVPATVRLTSYECPSHDGDLALLEELADRILSTPRNVFRRDDIPVSGTSIYNAVCYRLGVFPHR